MAGFVNTNLHCNCIIQENGKALTGVGQFVSALDDDVQEIAKNELGETDSARKDCLQIIRDWIDKNPRIIRIRYDDLFLLRFLRAKKFQILQTQDCIERYILLRNLCDGNIFPFKDMSINDKNLEDLIDLGYIFPLPQRDNLGRRVIMVRPGVFNIDKFSNVDMLKIHGLAYETLLEIEEVQVKGVVHIIDAAGINLNYLKLFTIKEAVRIVKNAEKVLPMRHKKVHTINVISSLKFAVDFALSLLSEKMKQRFIFHESITDIENLNMKSLPIEYGGEVPLREITDHWKQEIKAMESRILLQDKIKLNYEMYSAKAREGSVSALCRPLDYNASEDEMLAGISGSFRRLEVD